MFKVNNKNTRTTSLTLFSCFYCYFWTYFTPFSSVLLAEFEQVTVNPAGNYKFKVNNRNTGTVCEICSKSTIKTPGRRHNFGHILQLALVFLLLTLRRQMPVGNCAVYTLNYKTRRTVLNKIRSVCKCSVRLVVLMADPHNLSLNNPIYQYFKEVSMK